MHIDITRYKCFHQSKERYRIIYQQNLVPDTLPYGLARGSAFHIALEYRAKGYTDPQIAALMEQEGITDPIARASGFKLADAVSQYRADKPYRVTSRELEYKIPLNEGQRTHYFVGRLDEIIEDTGNVYVGECKTSKPERFNLVKLQAQWDDDIQADGVLIGANSLGHDVNRVMVTVAVDAETPVIHTLNTFRTEHQLELAKLYMYETCIMIQALVDTVGIDRPWPHILPSVYHPCGYNGQRKQGGCELGGLCERERSEWDEAGFRARKEHLEVLS